jgi:hypothetical protein
MNNEHHQQLSTFFDNFDSPVVTIEDVRVGLGITHNEAESLLTTLNNQNHLKSRDINNTRIWWESNGQSNLADTSPVAGPRTNAVKLTETDTSEQDE